MIALAPERLYVGGNAAVTVTAIETADQAPVDLAITVSLETLDGASAYPLSQGSTGATGHVRLAFATPDVTPGSYQLAVASAGAGIALASTVTVRSAPVLFLETDKPIYKPGQTIQARVLQLNNQLLPAQGDVEVTIKDAKGIKLFRKDLSSNAFGVAPFEMPLATQLNYGTWKISARAGTSQTTVDVRVERYVLPKFDIALDTYAAYYLADEPIEGTLSAFYFFGQPIQGTVSILASRYVGVWEEYATYSGDLMGGLLGFELPAVGYVSGTPGQGGAGSLLLEATVTDTSGHAETVSEFVKIPLAAVQVQLIPATPALVSGQPYEVAVVTKTPDGQPTDLSGSLEAAYITASGSPQCTNCYQWNPDEAVPFTTSGGIAQITLTAPEDVVMAYLTAAVESGGDTIRAEAALYAAYSPTSSFIHIVQTSGDPMEIGETATFDVVATHAATIYYDVFAAGHTVFSGYSMTPQISFQTTPQMAPEARLVAYQINPNNEVSADALPFSVTGSTGGLDAVFSAEQVLPGDAVAVAFQAETEAMIGVSVVDESVFALNEGRLNMRDVFQELEDQYLEPQQFNCPYGAYEVLNDGGMQVMSSEGIDVPESPVQRWDFIAVALFGGEGEGESDVPENGGGEGEGEEGLAEVTRVRQFFPETWVWMPDLMTDPAGAVTLDLTAPDSITTWRLHAAATSQSGIAIAESELVVFQEFFGDPDLPYAVTRGEKFPVRVQVYNYLDTAQNVRVQLTDDNWFDLLDSSTQTVNVDANSVAGVSFLISPTELGQNIVEVTLQSPQRADAVRKPVLVEAEGTTRETVENGVLDAGENVTLSRAMPPGIVPDSGEVILSITPSIVAQSINGLEKLLQMPYGCGEQNMIVMAPDVQVIRYLDATGQANPELRAKAEHLIVTGYQRELTYRHDDGSFSAFGEQDDSGSLWLTAFVLKVFSGAQEIIAIDENVLAAAAAWIGAHQNGDGSWDPVGFVCHNEMMGGVEGRYSLTAFIAVALAEYNTAYPGLSGATDYLAGHLTESYDDAYGIAIAALALEKLGHPAAPSLIGRLLELAQSDSDGIHWTPHDVETTAYSALALFAANNISHVNNAIAWLAAHRNSLGGYGSTQDTVMALEALFVAAVGQSANMDLTITARAASGSKDAPGEVLAEFDVDSGNFDVLQMAELVAGDAVVLSAVGSGSVGYQMVRRYNVILPNDAPPSGAVDLEVQYSAGHVEVDDLIDVTVLLSYQPLPGEGEGEGEGANEDERASGMLLVDVGVPTGFTVLRDSLTTLLEAGQIKRFEVAGRKVILYFESMAGPASATVQFQIKASFPVRALTPDSAAYRYYAPEVRDEVKGPEITVELEGSEGETPDEGQHSADADGDGTISLSEVLRVVQFYNSGGYGCQVGTEDGFSPGNGGTASCTAHDADYMPKDWSINLSELLRLIQFYNMGGYRACPDAIPATEDGYCPGGA